MSSDQVYVFIIFVTAAVAGHCVEKRQYGWAATLALMFFALLRY